MKVLIVNGSPRERGLVGQWLEAVAAEVQQAGGEVEWFEVADLHVQACTGCMSCRGTGECTLPADDGHRFARLVEECDALVVGTPTYWANMSTQLKLLFDRAVPAFIEDRRQGPPAARHRGKPAAVLSTCTTPWPLNVLLRQSRGATNAVRTILRSGGYRVLATLEKGGTRSSPSLSPREREAAERLGRRLAAAAAASRAHSRK